MGLKVFKKTVFKVDASDLNAFITEYFQCDYSVEAYLEMNRDSSEEIKVEKYEVDDDTVIDMKLYASSGNLQEVSIYNIMNHLCDLDEIEEGTYIVRSY